MEATVYRCLDKQGRLLYVGCTIEPERRIAQHRYSTRWWAEVDRIDRETYPDMEQGREAERAAILAELPLYNRTPRHEWQLSPPKGTRGNPPLPVRVSPEIRRFWKAAADKAGLPFSEWVRRRLNACALAELTDEVEDGRA